MMTANMTMGMGLWMRHQGHSLRLISEMAGAMFVPLAVLISPFWAGLISDGALMGAMHLLMLPAMVGVMLVRRDIYTQHQSTAPRHDTTLTHSAMNTAPALSKTRSPETRIRRSLAASSHAVSNGKGGELESLKGTALTGLKGEKPCGGWERL